MKGKRTFYSDLCFLQACLKQFSQGLQEMVGFHAVSTCMCTHTVVNANGGSELILSSVFFCQMLFDQMQRAINHQLSNLCTQ